MLEVVALSRQAAHLATVQQRQTLGRSETSLQLQLERAQQVLDTWADLSGKL